MKKKGFTLVELLAVIVLIGVLSTTAIYSFRELIERNNDTKLKNIYIDIQRAAKVFTNTKNVKFNEDGELYIPLYELENSQYIKKNIAIPGTDDYINDTYRVKMKLCNMEGNKHVLTCIVSDDECISNENGESNNCCDDSDDIICLPLQREVKNNCLSITCNADENNSYDTTLKYTGECSILNPDSINACQIKFLTSGELVSNSDIVIDAFIVGGGGSCGSVGSGGGGGYTQTINGIYLSKNTIYDVEIGDGGINSNGKKSWLINENSFYALGGNKGNENNWNGFGDTGGNGGSGGGASRGRSCSGFCGAGAEEDNAVFNYFDGTPGGRFGNGSSGDRESYGQGKTTCAFEKGTTTSCDDDYEDYSRGGDGNSRDENQVFKGLRKNYGDGGNGDESSCDGAKGAVLIRNSEFKKITYKDNVIGEYTGKYELIDDESGKWRIKFLSSGVFLWKGNTNIDLFVVGGGGYQSGFATTYKNKTLITNNYYQVFVGGGTDTVGETSYFNSISTYYSNGGDKKIGGSGQGKGSFIQCADPPICSYSPAIGEKPGESYGNSGLTEGQYSTTGQTTCEFNEGTPLGCTKGDNYAYSPGKGGQNEYSKMFASLGKGLSGDNSGAPGKSGIVIIRNAR